MQNVCPLGKNGVSRRNFFKRAGALAGLPFLSGCIAFDEVIKLPENASSALGRYAESQPAQVSSDLPWIRPSPGSTVSVRDGRCFDLITAGGYNILFEAQINGLGGRNIIFYISEIGLDGRNLGDKIYYETIKVGGNSENVRRIIPSDTIATRMRGSRAKAVFGTDDAWSHSRPIVEYPLLFRTH